MNALRRSFGFCVIVAVAVVGCVAPTERLQSTAPAERSTPMTPAAVPRSPDELYGPLFAAVQLAHVFEDQKTFADCVPRQPPERIVADYLAARERPGFELERFVAERFLVPEVKPPPVPETATLEEHLNTLWDTLRRAPDRAVPGSSLLPLPRPYIVPGGRFREVYYWDSYFTMLGLRESGREDLIADMIANFAHLLDTYGLIPNGNRTYYLTRSQPPFFSLMVEFLAEKQGDDVYRLYRDALRKEYAYWMDESFPTRHVVRLPEGETLNRYHDRADTPRPESFADDVAVSRETTQSQSELYRHLRSAAESGWDFSSRWFADSRTMATIETTSLVPVDLNCLLFHLEQTRAKAERLSGDAVAAAALEAAAERRRRAILRACWSPENGYFFDYDLKAGQRASAFTLAGVAPLFLGVAMPEQARAAARTIRERFLRAGGVVTTLVDTGQQWDAPNGWAPLQWMTIRGLERYGEHELAAEIARRWLEVNRDVYRRTGRMMEKYNVVDPEVPAGGGEYPSQDGFGWTNGVYLALTKRYPERHDDTTRSRLHGDASRARP